MNLCVTFFWCLFSIWFSSALAEDSPLKILKDRSQNFQAKSSGLGYGTTKEEILENRKNRRRQLRNLINDMRKKLANHSAGEITLAPDEKAAIEKRLDIFQRKLNSMEVELDEKVSTLNEFLFLLS